jgi:hypothetical protein
MTRTEAERRVIEAAETALGFLDGGEPDNALYTISCDLRVAFAALDALPDTEKSNENGVPHGPYTQGAAARFLRLLDAATRRAEAAEQESEGRMAAYLQASKHLAETQSRAEALEAEVGRLHKACVDWKRIADCAALDALPLPGEE